MILQDQVLTVFDFWLFLRFRHAKHSTYTQIIPAFALKHQVLSGCLRYFEGTKLRIVQDKSSKVLPLLATCSMFSESGYSMTEKNKAKHTLVVRQEGRPVN